MSGARKMIDRTTFVGRYSKASGLASDSEAPSLARDAITLSTAQGAGAILGLLSTFISARVLGPEGYGMAALVMSYPTLLWAICSFKPMTAATRYLSEAASVGRWEVFRSVCRICYAIDLSSAVVVVLIVQVTAATVAGLYATPDLTFPMLLYSVSLICSSLTGTSLAVLSALRRFQWTAAFYALDAGVTLFSVAVMLATGMGIAGVVVGTGIGHAVSGLVLMLTATWAVRRVGGERRGTSGDAVSTVRSLLMQSLRWNYLAVTASGIAGQAPLWLLGQFRDAGDVGFYRLATSVVTVGAQVETSLGRVALPTLTAVAARRAQAPIDLWRWTTREGVAAAAFVLALVPLMAFAVPRVFGQRYEPMILGLQLMLLGAAVSATFFWATAYHWAAGQIARYSRATIAYSILSVLVGAPCAVAWGFPGLAAVNGLGRVGFTLALVRLAVARHAN